MLRRAVDNIVLHTTPPIFSLVLERVRYEIETRRCAVETSQLWGQRLWSNPGYLRSEIVAFGAVNRRSSSWANWRIGVWIATVPSCNLYPGIRSFLLVSRIKLMMPRSAWAVGYPSISHIWRATCSLRRDATRWVSECLLRYSNACHSFYTSFSGCYKSRNSAGG